MTLSLLEKIALLGIVEKDVDHQKLPGFKRSNLSGGADNPYKTEKTLCELLDTLAFLLSVASSKPCAVSINLEGEQNKLTIAFNAGAARPGDVSKLVKAIYAWMQDATKSVDDEARYRLGEIVFKTYRPKIRLRFKEKSDLIVPVLREATRRGLTADQKYLIDLLYTIHEDAKTILVSEVASDQVPDYRAAYRLFESFSLEYKPALEKVQPVAWLSVAEKAVAGANGKANSPDVLRYFEKLLKPYIHIQTIVQASKSPKFQAVLQKKLGIDPLPSPSAKFSIPISEEFREKVRSYLKDSLKGELSEDTEDDPAADQAITSVLDRIRPLPDRPDLTAVSAHCECTLLHHHLTPRPSSSRDHPFSYFGCSKLSCFQCALYFQVCKELGLADMAFQTRGSHSGVVSCYLPVTTTDRDAATTDRDAATTDPDAATTDPDAATTERDAAIEGKMSDYVDAIFKRIMTEHLERQRTDSQSTVGSGGSSPDRLDQAVEKLKLKDVPL